MREIDSRYARMTALVVDDQPFVRVLVKRMLKNLGFQDVHEAGDGDGGLKLAAAHRPGLIVCDQGMEPMDGMAFLENLRGQEGGDEPVVIFLTQHADVDLVKRASDLGAASYVLKPPSPHELAQRIHAAFARR